MRDLQRTAPSHDSVTRAEADGAAARLRGVDLRERPGRRRYLERLPKRVLVCLAAAAIGFAVPGSAVPGALDRGFGSDGVVVLAVPGARVSVGNLLTAPGGKLLVGGGLGRSPSRGGRNAAFVARFLANGRRDRSFAGGLVELPVDEDAAVDDLYAPRAALTPSGGVVVVVGVRDGAVELARLRANGTLDPTFGSGGRVSLRVGDAAYGPDVVVEPDGRVVIAAMTSDRRGRRGDHGVVVARLTAAGSLDRSFADGGVLTLMLSRARSFRYTPARLARQPDGRLIVGTTVDREDAQGITRTDMVLVRLTPAGVVDPAFGGGRVRIATGASSLGEIALQRNGAILVVGGVVGRIPVGDRRTELGCCVVGVVRLRPDGGRDRAFGTRGTTRIGRGIDHLALAVQRDGRIVVTGQVSERPFAEDFAVARLTPTGRADTTFDVGGESFTDVTGRFQPDEASAVAVTRGGRIVVAGTTGPYAARRLALARYLERSSPARRASVRIAVRGRTCAPAPCRWRAGAPATLTARTTPHSLPSVVFDLYRYDERGFYWSRERQLAGRRGRDGVHSLTTPRGLLRRGRWRVEARVEATASATRGRSGFVSFTVG